MANCKKYLELLPIEKSTMIGEIVHAIQSDDELFIWGEKIRRKAKKKGLFDNVEINPSVPLPEGQVLVPLFENNQQ